MHLILMGRRLKVPFLIPDLSQCAHSALYEVLVLHLLAEVDRLRWEDFIPKIAGGEPSNISPSRVLPS